MTANALNPWVARYLPLLDGDEIKQRARFSPPTIVGLDGLPTQDAVKTIEQALEAIYVPSDYGCAILRRLVERAISHARTNYPGNAIYLSNLYAEHDSLAPEVRPLCLTGLAGVGKSQLLRALSRVLPIDDSVAVGHGHVLPLRSRWDISVRAKATLTQVLLPFIHDEGTTQPKRIALQELRQGCRRRLYRDGVALLTADEFQFYTQSTTANTRVTQALMFLSYLGVPWVFAANYSLCHRLLSRPQEDTQRLLADPIVLLPDAPDSEAWAGYLGECVRVAGEWLQIDPARDGKALHRYSAGLKRLVVCLVGIAYGHARESGKKSISIADIERAYCSTQFTSNRRDVEVICEQQLTGRMVREDLWCPFDLPKSVTAIVAERLSREREQRAVAELVESSLNVQEKVQLAQEREKAGLTPKKKTQPTKVVKLRKSGPVTADELLEGGRLFQLMHNPKVP